MTLRSLTIALMHYAGPPGVGGVEGTLAAHAHLFHAAGHRVRLLVGQGAAPAHGIDLVLIPELYSRAPQVEAVQQDLVQGIVNNQFEPLVQAVTERLLVALRNVDLLIVHNIHTLHKNLALTQALYRLTIAGLLPPTIAWCHDFAWADPLYTTELHAGLPWDLLRSPWPGVQYVVVSADRQAILCAQMGLSATLVPVIPPGIDPALILTLDQDTLELVQAHRLLESSPLLLLPARVTRRKNIELAIAIIGAMQQQGASPRLLITGPPGPHNPTNRQYLRELETLQATSGAAYAVVFLYRAFTFPDGTPRRVSERMLADCYRLADGLLFPSWSEGFGLPIIEAGLVGLPIFCSDIAPFHASAGDAAFYFDPAGDPHAIARQLLELLDADRRTQLRQRIRQTCSWGAIYANQLVPLLNTVVSRVR